MDAPLEQRTSEQEDLFPCCLQPWPSQLTSVKEQVVSKGHSFSVTASKASPGHFSAGDEAGGHIIFFCPSVGPMHIFPIFPDFFTGQLLSPVVFY